MIVRLRKFRAIALPFILFGVFAASAVFASAQVETAKPVGTAKPTEKPKIVISPTPPVYKDKEKSKTKKRIYNQSETPAEKSIAVDSKVKLQFCVSEGNVRVNGWDRNEIRAYVGGGSQIGFKVMQKIPKTGSPVWVKALGFDPKENTDAEADECLSGDEIEIDVPRGTTVEIWSQETATTIESVRKVRIEKIGGDIFLNDIAEGIYASTGQGGVTVGKSSGAMYLNTTDGNIVAYEVRPGEVGDTFKAKSIKGMITLQQIEYIQTEVNSTFGSIRFTGEFLSGGQYTFGTQNGSILLTVPEKSSCQINAFFGTGQFYSDIKMQNEKRTGSGVAQSLTGQIGGGDATITLKTYSGRINIKKQ